ncbi:MAG: hypothetical protein ACUVYA_12305 [Planctomycetota bacterium]
MEFVSPERTKGWATIARLPGHPPSKSIFRPKGLEHERRYEVTFYNARRREAFAGSKLAPDALALEVPAEPASELPLFEAVPGELDLPPGFVRGDVTSHSYGPIWT